MVGLGSDDPYSRYPMSFGDAIAALFRSKPKRIKAAGAALLGLARDGVEQTATEGGAEPIPATVANEPDSSRAKPLSR